MIKWALFLGAVALAGAAKTPTFSKDIRPMLENKCVSCHSVGGSGPFPLQSFAQVKRRASLVRYVAFNKKMPPTDATSDFGRMVHQDPLTAEELLALQGWIDAGMPEGEPLPPLEPKATPTEGTTVRTDAAPRVQAEGAPYRARFALQIPPGTFHGFRVRPVNPQSVRQVRLARAENAFSDTGLVAAQLLGTWAPGVPPLRLSKGIPHAGKLEVEVLYQPSGKTEDGNLEIDFFAGEQAGDQAWIRLGTDQFTIPGQDPMTQLVAEHTLESDRQLYAVDLDRRRYAQEVTITADIPGRGPKTLLHIFTWDQAWPGAYAFPAPIALPKGTKLTVETFYNNSIHSFGERRTRLSPVKFGPGPEDELFWTYFLLGS